MNWSSPQPNFTTTALPARFNGRFWLAAGPGGVPASFGAYAAIGTGALLASATQAPLSAVVLLELGTHVDKLIMPLLIAAALATTIARALDARSIYAVAVVLPGPPAALPQRGGYHEAATAA